MASKKRVASSRVGRLGWEKHFIMYRIVANSSHHVVCVCPPPSEKSDFRLWMYLAKAFTHPCLVFSCVCDPLVGTCLLDSTCGGSIRKVLPECSICLYCGHQAPCWYSDYNSLFGMLCRWHKVFSNLCVCSCCADLRCCSGSMRYVNKLSYQGAASVIYTSTIRL